MASLFSSVLAFRSANSCLSKSIDCSCSAFLAAAAFSYLLAPHTRRSVFPMLLLLPLWLCRNVCLVFVEARQDPFGVNSFVLFNFSNCAHWFCSSTSVCRARHRIMAGARSSCVDTFRVRDRQDSTRYTPGEISEITFHNSGI